MHVAKAISSIFYTTYTPRPPEGAVGGLTWHHYMCADEIVPMMEVEATLCQSSTLAEHHIDAKSDLV